VEIPVRLGEDLEGMILIVGRTRVGKTTLILNMVSQAIDQDFIVWYFDIENEARPLLLRHPDLLVISVDRWQDRDNLLQAPPGMKQERWIPIVVERLVNDFFLGDASKSFLRSTIFELIDRSDGNIPSLIQVKEYVDEKFKDATSNKIKTPFRPLEWMASVKNRLETIDDELGDNVNCCQGFDFEKLANTSIIFEMRDLSSQTQNFYRAIKTLKLYHYQMSKHV